MRYVQSKGSSCSPEEALALGVLQQHATAGLADALQQLARVLEVADVVDGQVQLDVACASSTRVKRPGPERLPSVLSAP